MSDCAHVSAIVPIRRRAARVPLTCRSRAQLAARAPEWHARRNGISSGAAHEGRRVGITTGSERFRARGTPLVAGGLAVAFPSRSRERLNTPVNFPLEAVRPRSAGASGRGGAAWFSRSRPTPLECSARMVSATPLSVPSLAPQDTATPRSVCGDACRSALRALRSLAHRMHFCIRLETAEQRTSRTLSQGPATSCGDPELAVRCSL